MARFVVGDDRSQSTLFPERLGEYVGEDNPVRAIDVFVEELDLAKLGFGGVEPEATGRPVCLLKTRNRRASVALLVPRPYRRGHDHASVRPWFPALVPAS
jgi:hypothetical protein